jgi:hypothetical protein
LSPNSRSKLIAPTRWWQWQALRDWEWNTEGHSKFIKKPAGTQQRPCAKDTCLILDRERKKFRLIFKKKGVHAQVLAIGGIIDALTQNQ